MQAMAKKKTRTFTFIDLFAGIGGMRQGFEHVGGECVFSSEWDKFAQVTYQANFGEVPHGDITKIEADEIPDHDLILAGFPCQPFSHAGLKLGFDDMRGTLFFDVARIISEKRPAMVLLENVKGFVNHDRGRTFLTIKDVLENELGYWVFHKVLNASDFGLPQNRERIFIVCFDKDRFPDPDFEFPKPTGEQTRVGDILESEVDRKYVLSTRLWQGHKRRKREHIAKGNGFGYSLFNPESVRTSTISARYYKDGSEVLIARQGNPRKITPREAARLQGFPDSYVIPVSDTQAYKQFGNSVAVNVIKAIAVQMKLVYDSSLKQ
jgi:DNA (cytosine-5)-methyltransferase 1